MANQKQSGGDIEMPSVVRRAGRPSIRTADAAGVRTLMVGITLLKAIARLAEPANLSEIARRVNVPVSRAHRYLTTLVQSGMLSVDAATGLYSLGPASIELGVRAMSNTDALQVASLVMRKLTARTSLVSIATVWGTNGPTVVRWEQGQLEAAVHIREGINLSLLVTAAGQIFLAFLDWKMIAEQVNHDLRSWNRTAPQNRRFNMEKVKALRQSVLDQGMASVAGIRNPLVAAISAPVFDRNGLVMSLTLTGIQGTFDPSAQGTPAKELLAGAREITNLLGGKVR